MTPICESNFSLGVSCVLFFSLVMYLELVSHLFLVITDEGVETWKGWQHTEGCSALKYQGRGLTCLVLVQESEMRVGWRWGGRSNVGQPGYAGICVVYCAWTRCYGLSEGPEVKNTGRGTIN